MTQNKKFDSIFLLQICIGVLLIVTGIAALSNYNSDLNEFQRELSNLFGGNTNSQLLIIGIARLAFGVIILLIPFISISRQVKFILIVAAFIVYGCYIAYSYVINQFLKPDFIPWAVKVLPELVILNCLWIIARRNA